MLQMVSLESSTCLVLKILKWVVWFSLQFSNEAGFKHTYHSKIIIVNTEGLTRSIAQYLQYIPPALTIKNICILHMQSICAFLVIATANTYSQYPHKSYVDSLCFLIAYIRLLSVPHIGFLHIAARALIGGFPSNDVFLSGSFLYPSGSSYIFLSILCLIYETEKPKIFTVLFVQYEYLWLHFSTIVIIFQGREHDEWTDNVNSQSTVLSLNCASGPIQNFPQGWVPTIWCHTPKDGNLLNHWHRNLSYNNSKSDWHILGNRPSIPNVAEVCSVGLYIYVLKFWSLAFLLTCRMHDRRYFAGKMDQLSLYQAMSLCCSQVSWNICASTSVLRQCNISTIHTFSSQVLNHVEMKESTVRWRWTTWTTCPALTLSHHWYVTSAMLSPLFHLSG